MKGEVEGREEVRAGYRAAWGASRAEPQEICEVVVHESADPEVITVEQTVCGVVTTTGESFSFPGLLVLRVRNGLIVYAPRLHGRRPRRPHDGSTGRRCRQLG
ncbi:nuclear transport factor 2 family protein [Streptomyces inhibens]|uniref:nuclear transport factor 2 family protein n=1 Tax=Streptomyces inhibens TaxID=2293571 RepID=UPI00368E21C6